MMDRNIHGEINVWSAAQRQKRSTDLILMLGLRETMHQLAMANSVCWHCHVFRREDGHVLRRPLYIKVEVQRNKGRSKEEMEVKGRNGDQRKNGRSKEEWEVKERNGG